MNLDKIINDVEEIPDITDRCIAYANVISYLKRLRAVYYFNDSEVEFENDINKLLLDKQHCEIDNAINKIKEMITINVDINKFIQ